MLIVAHYYYKGRVYTSKGTGKRRKDESRKKR
jgi:hypothetical protein